MRERDREERSRRKLEVKREKMKKKCFNNRNEKMPITFVVKTAKE